MICMSTGFQAELIRKPQVWDERKNCFSDSNYFTVGKIYDIIGIFDNNNPGSSVTDFLIADDLRIFRWVSMSYFKAITQTQIND